jgi:hypothetical protein
MQRRRDGEFDASVGEVAKMPRLRSLLLVGDHPRFDARDLGRLEGLWSLALGCPETMTDLSPLADCRELRFLHLFNSSGLEDISHAENLQRLIEITFIEVPDELEDLSPLARLPNLRTLGVGKGILEQRKGELDALREANPELEIVGICMGSAWILAVVPLAALGAAVLRRRRRRT